MAMTYSLKATRKRYGMKLNALTERQILLH
jgi:hypothetical protein